MGGEQLSDQDVFNFIFEPGFSTAEQVTDVSGRGVGMDVVRKHIVKLRGRIDISSRPGRGTTFVIKLPLTMAIIEGLVVGVGVHRYIVPIFVVKEMFRPAPESLSDPAPRRRDGPRARVAHAGAQVVPAFRRGPHFGGAIPWRSDRS